MALTVSALQSRRHVLSRPRPGFSHWLRLCEAADVGILLLINGAPGSGKSTIANRVAASRPMALALDIDLIKHSLGSWHNDPYASGVQARRLAVAMSRQHLQDGYDVIIGQYLARPDFILDLERLADDCGARWVEVILHLDPPSLAERIQRRHLTPDRTEHAVNNTLVSPNDAPALAASIAHLHAQRPHAVVINAHGTLDDVASAVGGALRS